MDKKSFFKLKIRNYIRQHKILLRLNLLRQYIKLHTKAGKETLEKIEENLNLYVKNPEKRSNARYIKKLVKDILYCRFIHYTDFEEYFLYRFEKLNEIGRSEYVGKLQQRQFWNKFDQDGIYQIFEDKEKTYQTFKPYYGREMVKIETKEDKSVYDSFVSQHGRFIVKPINDKQGHGVHIVDMKNVENEENSFTQLIQHGGVVLEEVIKQDPEMAKFHPQSVNTIRYVTFYHKNQLTKISAILRMGRCGGCIDNACAGGIYAVIDLEHGVIGSYGTSHRMEKYLYHPDTGAQILGAKIPRWDELNQLVEKVVRVVPEQKQVGWDFALTEAGWIIVEANNRPGIQFLDHGHGLREVFQVVYDAYNE